MRTFLDRMVPRVLAGALVAAMLLSSYFWLGMHWLVDPFLAVWRMARVAVGG